MGKTRKYMQATALSVLFVVPVLASAASDYVEIDPGNYRRIIDGKQTDLYTLKNDRGMIVKITNYGGKVVQLLVPDKNGRLGDVAMGFDTLEESSKYVPSAGAIIGRYANRITKGLFSLDGKQYQLSINNNVNHLHGGKKGSRFVVFDAKQIDDHALQLNYYFKDGEEGYPGNCNLKVIYSLSDDNALTMTYDAVTDKPTIVNFSNHTNFNLTGTIGTSIEDHIVTINADTFAPADKLLMPTGERRDVTGSPFDFRRPAKIRDLIYTKDEQLKNGQQLQNPPVEGGYDHNWFLNKAAEELSFAARVLEPTSGRVLEIYTTEPVIHWASGNSLAGTEVGKGGKNYIFRGAFVMLAEHPDDSPNQPQWPTTVLRPGEWFSSTTIYKFSTLP
jgi:aldose 1-epimerase